MLPSRPGPRFLAIAHKASKAYRSSVSVQRRCYRGGSWSSAAVDTKASPRSRKAAFLLSATIVGGILYTLGYPTNLHAELVPAQAEVRFEETRRPTVSKEENRDLISSQHLQVKVVFPMVEIAISTDDNLQKSWESPGIYAWGSNSGRVVALDSDETIVKTPRRIPYFDGKLVRDIKLDKYFGAAISENGDLLQWGTGFAQDCRGPVPTLRGKDLVKMSISRDRIIALSSNGTVYSVSAARADQEAGHKPQESSWLPFWKWRSPVSYRRLSPTDLAWGEKVSDIRGGLDHCLILTSKGRLFSAAAGTETFPEKGQMGIPGLTWNHRPEGAYDQLHEIRTLKGFEIVKIAAGDYHSLAVDKEGRVFAFGDNSLGQLGFEYNSESPIIDAPSLLPITSLYKSTNQVPRVTDVFAGGVNSFFTIDSTRVAGQGEDDPRSLGRVTADTWACGQGIWGGLGNGRWTHVQGIPTKIRALSGLFEYDEVTNKVVPIRLSHVSVGSTHASAVMNNVTHLKASNHSSDNDTNWGADVLWWGGNEFYQLGTGKRNNVSNPVYIPPMDVEADKEKGRREEHRFQITPRKKIKFNGRNVSVEQRIECGRGVTAVYSGT